MSVVRLNVGVVKVSEEFLCIFLQQKLLESCTCDQFREVVRVVTNLPWLISAILDRYIL